MKEILIGFSKKKNNTVFSLIFSSSQKNEISLCFIEKYNSLKEKDFLEILKKYVYLREENKIIYNEKINISKKSIEILKRHHIWCNSNKILKLPEVFYNHRKLNSFYSISDVIN